MEYKEEQTRNELDSDVTVFKVFNGEREEVSISEIMPSKVRIQPFFISKH